MMVGDGESQPTEGAVTLDDIADAMIGSEAASDESDEGEESDEAEGSEAEEEGDEEEGEEPTFTIKVDGKDVTLTQTELIERAQKGTDYTNKTMAVAEERKAVEAERAALSDRRAKAEEALNETVHRLETYSQFMQAQVGQMPDVSMLDYDTAGFLRAKEAYEARRGQLHEARAAIQQLQDEQARHRQALIAEAAEATERALRDTLPGWNDDMLLEYAKYADGLGLNPGTAEAAFVQKGFWELIHKAKAFDALQAKKAELKPKEKLAKVAKPSVQNQPAKVAERIKREQSFNKNPSVDSLAEFLR